MSPSKLICIFALPFSGFAQPADGIAFFETKIRPVLTEHCYKCHSAKSEKIKGGLVLDTREGIRKGGETGPGIVPGDLKKSLVIEALRYTNHDLQMPPEKSGGKLSETVISDFEHWVDTGAHDPREGAALAVKAEWDTEKAKQHWAFQPIKQHPVPDVNDKTWPRSPIDHFILAGLESKGLKAVGDASPPLLLRRLCFDLTGLPPTLEELAAFDAHSYEHTVDRLLQSPRFAERWARRWLDVARYAESTGKDVNCLLPHAWRYRDYVIDAFNTDKPIDQFFKEQIAGDLLPASNSRDRALKQIATGFLAIGARSLNERSPRQYALDTADEQIDAMSQSMLGLTVACARCHDHKFDPIPQRDYYALAGIFLSTETCYGTAATFQNTHPARLIELPTDCGLPRLPVRLPEERRKQRERELTQAERYGTLQFYSTAVKAKLSGQPLNVNNDPQKLIMFVGVNAKIGEIKAELNNYESDGRPKLLAMGVNDYPASPAFRAITKPKSVPEVFEMLTGRPHEFTSINDSPLFQRGDAEKPGERVPRGFVSIVSSKPANIPTGQSGRLELAEWLVSKDNPLTSRVFVNRVWHWLFGRGIVETVDNFGTMGQLPANPALLDYLALRLQSNQWSLKALIKEIVMSHTYRLSSTFNEVNFETDPDNTLVWRMKPRRLDAECIRDAMLAVSDGLQLITPVGSPVAQRGDAAIGGFPIKALRSPLSDELFISAGGDLRSIYLPVPRNAVPDALTIFDFAEPSAVNGSREVTTVPAQALYLLNNEFVSLQAQRFAERLKTMDSATCIETAFRLAFGRPPTVSEMKTAREFIGTSNEWTSFCRSLLASAEFRTLD